MARGRRATPREPGIAAAIVEPVILALASFGVATPGWDAAVAGSRGEMIPGSLADSWLAAAAAALDDEAIGVRLAPAIPNGALGLLDYAMCTSATMRDALERVARHYAIATQRVTLTLVEAPPRAALVLARAPGVAHGKHWIEFSLAAIGLRMRRNVGRDFPFDEVTFRHEGPPDTSAHDRFFGTRVRFGQAEDRMVFPHDLLAAPLVTASAALAALLDARMRELAPAAAADTFLDEARRAIAALLDTGETAVEPVAKRMHVSRRTLQRELARRGTSHKDLLDEMRRERALVLLGEARTVADVAARLGYSEPSAFFRAFRRWTGTSPRAQR